MYRPIFNQLIFEELSISGEVQQETVNMWKKIKDCIPQIKMDAYVDYDYATHNEIVLEGVKYGSYSFSSYIFNEKITVFINLYNFVDKSHYNKYKDKLQENTAKAVINAKIAAKRKDLFRNQYRIKLGYCIEYTVYQ